MNQLGRRLRQAAQDLGLSDAEIARRSGLDGRRYGHYVTGAREPDLATLVRICAVLSKTPNDLLGFAETSRKPGPADKLKTRLMLAATLLGKAELELLVVQAEAVVKFVKR
jgi:transcriptional regulator with XRE-family HTH domain